nr:unnamed protein product [Callosobruchus analis]
MSPSDFDTILNLVGSKIAKKTPHFENQSPFQRG